MKFRVRSIGLGISLVPLLSVVALWIAGAWWDLRIVRWSCKPNSQATQTIERVRGVFSHRGCLVFVEASDQRLLLGDFSSPYFTPTYFDRFGVISDGEVEWPLKAVDSDLGRFIDVSGFSWSHNHGGSWNRVSIVRFVTVPYWAMALLAALCPTWQGIRQYRKRLKVNRLAQGQCPDCGYDVRATPERCPECGRRFNSEGAVSRD